MFLFSIELDEAPLVQTAASLFRDMCYRYREELMAGIIVAGWDQRRGGQVQHYDCKLKKKSVDSGFC